PLTDKTFGFGNQMGLAVFNGHVYPVWAGNLNQATVNTSTGVITANPVDIFYRPMAIAAGPRIITSTMAPIPLSQPTTPPTALPFARPFLASPFLPGDVQVFFRGTATNSPAVPLKVTSITPSSGVSSQFTITFDPLPAGANPVNYNYTGTYSYLIEPDNGAG